MCPDPLIENGQRHGLTDVEIANGIKQVKHLFRQDGKIPAGLDAQAIPTQTTVGR
jgi:hypothetical protein